MSLCHETSGGPLREYRYRLRDDASAENRGGNWMSMLPFNRRDFLKAGAGGVSLVGLSTAVSATDNPWPELELTAEGDETTPGGEAIVDFSITNTGNATTEAPVGIDSIPVNDQWTELLDESDDAGGEWRHLCVDPGGCYSSWRLGGPLSEEELLPGETREPALTLSIEDDAEPGSYDITVTASYESDDHETEDEATATIEIADEIDAEITLLDIVQDVYEPGEELVKEVLVENTGGQDHEFSIQSYLIPPDGPRLWSNPEPMELEDGDSETDTIGGDLPDDITRGWYDAGVIIFDPETDETLDQDIWETAFEIIDPVEGPELGLTGEGDETTPGGEATVEFTLSNTGDATGESLSVELAGIAFDPDWEITSVWDIPVSDPPPVVDHPEDLGSFDVADRWWQVGDLLVGESRTLTVTFEAPSDDTPDEYAVEATEFDSGEEATAIIEVSTDDEPDLARFDQDGDGQISRDDAVAAIVAFNTGGTIGGEPVTRDDAVAVIIAYNTGVSVGQ